MPEALAIIVVFATCALIYVVARFQSRNPAKVDAAAELERLLLHEAWLRDRLSRAERERWDQKMVASITQELRETSDKITRATISSGTH
jgi:hypothetical protein